MSLSIHGAGTSGLDPRPAGADRPASGETRASLQPQRGADASPVRSERVAASGVEAGVDARIWNLLTGEERAFYLQHASNGPLTYAPAASSGAARPSGRHLGEHVDLRM